LLALLHSFELGLLERLTMYGVVIGVLLVALKLAGIEPVMNWSWWWILSPLGAAVVWWSYADSSGLTKRREMEKMEDRKKKRREENMANLGMDTRGRRGRAKR
jgi:small Trp-rich protein